MCWSEPCSDCRVSTVSGFAWGARADTVTLGRNRPRTRGRHTQTLSICWWSISPNLCYRICKHTYSHAQLCIYMYVCVCVRVCVCIIDASVPSVSFQCMYTLQTFASIWHFFPSFISDFAWRGQPAERDVLQRAGKDYRNGSWARRYYD